MRKAFDNGGLADAWLADQDGIVFRAAGEDLHHATNFFIAADDRVKLGTAREIGQVTSVFFKRRVGSLGILRGDALAATDSCERLENGLVRSTVLFQKAASRVAVFAGDG